MTFGVEKNQSENHRVIPRIFKVAINGATMFPINGKSQGSPLIWVPWLVSSGTLTINHDPKEKNTEGPIRTKSKPLEILKGTTQVNQREKTLQNQHELIKS